MRVLAVGGGSGGHVTPAIAVLKALSRELNDTPELRFICDKGFSKQAHSIVASSGLPIKLHVIASGKLRRYRNFSAVDYLLHPSILLQNIVDMFKVLGGFFQSLWLLLRWRPDVIFCKGGFVCLPVGFAARLLRVPLVVHDSDARPGLTNRILAPFAAVIATGYPLSNYTYPASKARYTGVPIRAEFTPVSDEKQRQLKEQNGVAADELLVVSFGGGLGAQSINDAIIRSLDTIERLSMHVIAISGLAHFERMKKEAGERASVTILDFVSDGMPDLLAAADIVVTRASATALQELAGLAKTTVAVPARQLGDQFKNAALYADADAAIVLSDDDLDSGRLGDTLTELAANSERRQKLAVNMHKFAKNDAALDVARLIIETAKEKRR